jgi:hypothetical protein
MVGTHGSFCQCQHELAEPAGGTQWLNEYIDIQNVVSINEEHSGACKSLFRPYSKRLVDPEPTCRLIDEDPELIEEGLVIHVPFTCAVKLTGITIIGGDNGRCPDTVRLFSDLADPSSINDIREPSQSIDPLVEDFCGVVEYPLRPVKFANINSLTIQFPCKDAMEVNWIGIKGIASGEQRRAVVTVYEARPNVADHEVKEDAFGVKRGVQ